jgi:hypothetical protein
MTTRNGRARLTDDGGNDYGEVEYRIDVRVSAGTRQASGTLSGEFGGLQRAFQKNHGLKLQLASGREIGVVITEYLAPSSECQIALADTADI